MNGLILDPLAMWGRQDMTCEQMRALIAGAPDLLEALRDLLHLQDDIGGPERDRAEAAARAAIAKAENATCYMLARKMQPGEVTP
ncbi:MAG: hypothetical protein Q8Q28_10380 [Pseudomonadota bacterium]|nr:hypothetical protein [Pseudomonadota bacterium]